MKPMLSESTTIRLRGVGAVTEDKPGSFRLADLNTQTAEAINASAVTEGERARQSLTDLARNVATASAENKLKAFILSAAVVAGNVREGLIDPSEASRELELVAMANNLATHFGSGSVTDAIKKAEARMVPTIWRDTPDTEDTGNEVSTDLSQLALLAEDQYERVRKEKAKELGVRASILDRMVTRLRPEQNSDNENTDSLGIPEAPLWEESVDGDKLLAEISFAIRDYVVLPKTAADATALWVVHSYTLNSFRISPRLAIQSPEKGCGKTTLLDVLTKLVWRPLPTSNATSSVIFRVVEKAHPTLLIDEADTFLRDNNELRGILNSGHRQGGFTLRNVGDDHEPKRFSTWSACAIALIGRLPDTLEDRSVVVSLRRRKPDERVKVFRFDDCANLDRLASMARRWATDYADEIRACRPDMGELQNRRADNWEPLLSVATVAGGDWVDRVWASAAGASVIEKEQSVKAMLLSDIRDCFAAYKNGKIKSEQLVNLLVAMEDRPWGEWGRTGKPISKNSLARTLAEFGIAPNTIRVDASETAKGYKIEQFADAFDRYLPPNPDLNRNNVTTLAAEALPTLSQPSQPENTLRSENGEKANNDGACDVVTVGKLDIEAFEERAASLEYEQGLSRNEAEAQARSELAAAE